MPRLITLRLCALVAFTMLLAACGGDADPAATPPIAEVTAAPPPIATAPVATPPPPQPTGSFVAGPTVRLEGLQGVVWQRAGAGLLAYNRNDKIAQSIIQLPYHRLFISH